MPSRSLTLFAALASGLTLAACGGSPTGPSGAVNLRGTVVGDTSAAAAASISGERAASSAARITVTVQEEPGLTTTVSGDGTFALDGVPEGRFTLAFTRDGVPLGTIDIAGATAGQDIQITVRVSHNRVVLVDMEKVGRNDDDEDAEGDNDGEGDGDASRTCAISGGKVGEGIELEGHVAAGDSSGFELRVNGNRVKNGATVRVATSGASFKCNGKPTATECRSTVKPSAQVHVRGQLNTCDLSNALVAASEVKVQKP
jgi:hypothetical protein